MTVSEQIQSLHNEQMTAFTNFKNSQEKRIDSLEAKLNRMNLGGRGGSSDDQKKFENHLEIFRDRTGIKNATPEHMDAYRNAFMNYIRFGPDRLSAEMRNALSVGSDPNGGFWVMPDLSGRIVEKIYLTSPLRQLVSPQPIGTDALEGLIDNDLSTTQSGWVAEQAPRSQTPNPQIGKWRVPLHEQYSMPAITQTLLDDTSFDVESWLVKKIGKIIALRENTAFVSGNGSGKPMGFLSYPLSSTTDSAGTRPWGTLQYIPTGVSGGFATDTTQADVLTTMIYSLKAPYRQGAVWAMNSNTIGVVRKMKDTLGRFLWTDSLIAGQPPMLLGYPVIAMEDLPDIAANSLSIVFGNFAEAYQIVSHRVGLRILRDPYTAKPNVLFYGSQRIGGGLIDTDALKILKFSAS